MNKKNSCRADFIVVRAPKLSLTLIKNIPTLESELLIYLSRWLSMPNVLESIYLASPSVIERIELWRESPHSKSGKKVTSTLLKYLIRMTCRATPFGLFSGVALGNLADTTCLKPGAYSLGKRITRLDMHYLNTIQQKWSQSDDGLKSLCVKPNSTLYLLGDVFHFIEYFDGALRRQYRLCSVECDYILKRVLAIVGEGLTVSLLVNKITKEFPDVEFEEAENYVKQLVSEQILIPQLKLPLTSRQPDVDFIEEVMLSGNVGDAERLAKISTGLSELDRKEFVALEDYKNILEKVKELPYDVFENKLFQVDILSAFDKSYLSKEVLSTIETTLLSLKLLTPQSENPLKNFITQFRSRFESQLVPLLQILDEEAGISFSDSTSYDSPLIKGINIGSSQRSRKGQQSTVFEKHLISKCVQTTDSSIIQLHSKDILSDATAESLWQQFPASFAANISCYRDCDNNPVIYWHGCYGPSGANLLGRFCHLDTTLEKKVREYLALEQASFPDVVFAEIVHMPDGRPGNVIARPALRDYEIVFFGDSNLPEERQIQVNDLYVYIENDQVKLWSSRLNKQVIPRLSSAHNFSSRSLGIYRFLCMLQHQSSSLPRLSFPSSFTEMVFQPRIQLDNVILREAHWLVDRVILEKLVKDGVWKKDVWEIIEKSYKLPRYVCYSVSDNVLTIDLFNFYMVTMLLTETKNIEIIILKESISMLYLSEVKNDIGDYAHEIIVPLFNPIAKAASNVRKYIANNSTGVTRYFGPGSEWLSIKIYAKKSTAESILTSIISPLLKQGMSDGLFKQWFFIRYGDEDWHIRLRLFGEPAKLYGQMLPLLNEKLAPLLSCQRIHRIELSTYQREIERYGGYKAIIYAEKIFQADSEMVLNTMQLVDQYGESVRWRMAVIGVDAILNAFGYDLAKKLALISQIRKIFGVEFRENASIREELGRKYREYSHQILNDLQPDASSPIESPFREMTDLKNDFLSKVKPIASELFQLKENGMLDNDIDALLSSLLHMFNNRVFKSYAREQEFVVYDILRRFYLSKSKKVS